MVSFKKLANIKKINIKKGRIKKINFSYNHKHYTIEELKEKNIKNLYIFFKKFIRIEKLQFGYPLFQPINLSLYQFKKKYFEYMKERKSWIYHILFYEEKIIGMYYIKKIGFKNIRNTHNKSPTFGGPYIIKKYRDQKLGFLLTKLCFYQMQILEIRKLYSKIRSNNQAALATAFKSGYKMVRKIYKKDKNYFEIEFCKVVNIYK